MASTPGISRCPVRPSLRRWRANTGPDGPAISVRSRSKMAAVPAWRVLLTTPIVVSPAPQGKGYGRLACEGRSGSSVLGAGRGKGRAVSDRNEGRSGFAAWAGQLDGLARMQQMMSRLALPAEQIRSLTENLNRLLIPQQQVEAMLQLMEALSPPIAQLQAMAERVDEQLAELKVIEKELVKFRTQLERFTALSEQMVAIQEPLARVARMLAPDRSSSKSSDD